MKNLTHINSRFDIAPLSEEDRELVEYHVFEIVEAQSPLGLTLLPGKEGKLGATDTQSVEPEILEKIETVVGVIRRRVDMMLVKPTLRQVSVIAAHIDINGNDFADLEKWHIDSADGTRVFMASGDVASLECISGKLTIASKVNDQNIAVKALDAVEVHTVTLKIIPNNCPIILYPETVHRKGPTLKSGRTFFMNMYYR